MGTTRTEPQPEVDLLPVPDTPTRPLPPKRRMWPLLATLAVLVAFLLAREVAPGLLNPFRGETVDRTGPAVLLAIEDLSEYRAATGHFEVIVDLEEDRRFLPSFVAGERTLFVASGSVDATVDFAGLGEDAVSVSPDRQAVTLRLPHATLSEAVIDPEASYIYDRQRGLVDRLESLFSEEPQSERELYLLAAERLQAAAGETDLVDTAEDNTRAMIETLLRSLGFSEVAVRFS